VRFSWLEAACVISIALAALWLSPAERDTRLLAPSQVVAGKSWAIFDTIAVKRVRSDNGERYR
jgi:hypothetical protein